MDEERCGVCLVLVFLVPARRGHVHYESAAEVAERQTRYVQGVVSIRSCGFKSHLRHHHALVAQRIERSPAEAEAVGSSPTQRATISFGSRLP
jgi:uncharacterized protein (DUF2342 family)